MKSKLFKWLKNFGTLNLGLLLGTAYGAVVGTLTCYFVLLAQQPEANPICFCTVDDMETMSEELSRCEDKLGRR